MKDSTREISPLRQRMLEDMRLRKLAPQTQASYVRAVRRLAGYLRRPPDTATVYTYRRTRHYSLVLMVAASVLGLLAATLIRILNSEMLVPRLRTDLFDAMILSYAAYMVFGIWGAAALFRSYIRLADASKASIQPKAE